MRSKSVTARDVAALAGVAVGTVSNVLNRPDRVSPATIRRVTAAIDQLGWSRNQVAQQLAGGRSVAIGAVVVELSPLTVSLLDMVEGSLAGTGLALQVATSGHDPGRELQRIQLFEQQRIQGMLLSPVQSHYEQHVPTLKKLGIPVVLLSRVAGDDLCWVSGDDVAGGRLAVGHLIRFGHRRIAVVGGRSGNHHVRARIDGARSVLPPDASIVVLPTETNDVRAGFDAANLIMQMSAEERPTAVFAINDLIAIGVQSGLFARGVRVPAEMSVVGYDDIAVAAAAPVGLTTIRHSHQEVAHRATTLLLQEIEAMTEGGQHTHQQVRLERRSSRESRRVLPSGFVDRPVEIAVVSRSGDRCRCSGRPRRRCRSPTRRRAGRARARWLSPARRSRR